MQDMTRITTANSLPRLGTRLTRLRAWENDFRYLAGERQFAELNLPLSLPACDFVSRLTGEGLLPNAPRFLDSNGTEWSLRTDLTVFSARFVCQHAAELRFPFRLFYSGKVFSPQGLLGAEGFRLGHASEFESLEFGAEIIGDTTLDAELQLLDLALAALRRFGYSGISVGVGDVRISAALENLLLAKIADEQLRADVKAQLREAVVNKDGAVLAALMQKFEIEDSALSRACPELSQLSVVVETLRAAHPQIQFFADPLLTRQRRFYSGLVFDFWATDAHGFFKNVGGGGRYDRLLEHFGVPQAAVGFMLRDPQTAGVEEDVPAVQSGHENSSVLNVKSSGRRPRRPVRVALPKGRLQKWGIQAFADVGIRLSENPESTRKLVLLSECGQYEFLFVKNSDVVSYVERGIADVAIAGSDSLDEADVAGVLRPVTFAFGQCRICLAGLPQAEQRLMSSPRPRVATKYPHLARRLLRGIGLLPELVPLQGSVELASVISFSDAIVDLVETGSTLRENGLVVFRELAQTRVQLVTSRSYYAQFPETLRHWQHHWLHHGHVAAAHFGTVNFGEFTNDSDSQNS